MIVLVLVVALVVVVLVLGLAFHELTTIVVQRRLDESEAEENSRPIGNVDVLDRRGPK